VDKWIGEVKEGEMRGTEIVGECREIG